MPHSRKVTTTVIVAASAFAEALPNVCCTSDAVSPVSLTCATRR